MKNHPSISDSVEECDHPILKCLIDVQLNLHTTYGFGFDLVFEFETDNPYFMESKLTKKFVMSRANVIEKTDSTPITWKEGKDPTRKQVKKKKKGKQ